MMRSRSPLGRANASALPVRSADGRATRSHARRGAPGGHQRVNGGGNLHPAANGFNSRAGKSMLSGMEQFALTERAAARIAEIVAGRGPGGGALRVAVLAGGCSGSRYRFELDATAQRRRPGDRACGGEGAGGSGEPRPAGSELDYTDELMGSHFAVRNPECKVACGCGTSFSVTNWQLDMGRMPSYFDRFGMPDMSIHVMNRLHQRHRLRWQRRPGP